MDFATLVKKEVKKAYANYGPHNSLHESFAILLEEVDELWDEVRKKRKDRDPENILLELVQIAATAQKAAESHGLLGRKKCKPKKK